MIWYNKGVKYCVSLTDKDGKAFPEIKHEGVTYVVCTAGQEFEVEVSRKPPCWKPEESFVASLSIDGRSVLDGFGYRLEENRPNVTVRGWWVDHKTQKAFVFSAPDARNDILPGMNADSVTGTIKVLFEESEKYLCPALEGRECSWCNLCGYGTRTITQAAPETAGSIIRDDDKKFFLQPSLGAKAGAQRPTAQVPKERFHGRVKNRGHGYTMRLRMETAPILQLRKILVPSNPEHAKLLPVDSRATNIPSPPAEEVDRVMDTDNAMGPSTSALPSKVKKEKKASKKNKRKASRADFKVTYDLTEDTIEDQDCMMYTVAKRAKVETPPLLID